MKYLLTFSLLLLSYTLSAQYSVMGNVLDTNGNPIEFATVALLKPADSTLVNFGVSASDGRFTIKNAAQGKFILQISFIGYRTYDTLITIPLVSGYNLGIFILQRKATNLSEVEVNAERIPLQFKNDTIEYNAGAYKTHPDASAEDLLKKLPGVEVDQAGNIKAQGEDVNQVLVDGKEFFSSDPKVATKNLPADAINKVQVFDKRSDEAEFTGIDDGSRSKTINLLLKDDKKSAWLGELQAGYGTDHHYQANAKAYRFSHTNQFALLGMLNNINQFGFTFSDYIDFNGGIGSLMNGGGSFRIETGAADNLPINFGQPMNGLITSGAGGLNFTHEAKPGNRINVSYLGNGYDKNLVQNTYSQNFTPDYSYTTDEDLNQHTTNLTNRINFNFRNKPDSMQSIFANGGLSLTGGKVNSDLFTESFSSDSLTNTLNSETYDNNNGVNGNGNLTYLHRSNSKWKVFKAQGTASVNSSLSETEWNNITQYFNPAQTISDNQYQDDQNKQIDFSGSLSVTRELKETYFAEPLFRVGGAFEELNRRQGIPSLDNSEIDSLSPELRTNNMWLQPGIAFRHNTDKTNWRLSLSVKDMWLQNILDGYTGEKVTHLYFTPQFSFRHEIRRGMNFHFMFDSRVNPATASQLLPVTNYINPLNLFTGNISLRPEQVYNFDFSWMVFDQFSFTSVFMRLHASYTDDKINYSKTINNDLSQSLTLVNVDHDYSASASAEFSTPLRFAGVNIRIGADEWYNKGINYVNGTENEVSTFQHGLDLSFDNRKKEKIDAVIGVSVEWSTSEYSVQSEMNSRYFNWTYFTEIQYTPTVRWRISFNADLNYYNIEGFAGTIGVPLLQAEIVRYFLKGNRGTISLKGFDLLDKNSGVTQTSNFNYLQQQTANAIGRYLMMSIKYRLNKFDGGDGADIKVNGR